MIEMMLQTPCRADAQRAADALAQAGVARVLLFGSLARGEAGEGSDIDLVAVFDDLDYAQRRSRRHELAGLARAASGHRVDMHVTDRPEWRVRTEQVLTSFERRIAAHAVPLTDTPPGDVSWEKEIGLPASDVHESAARLKDTLRALIALEGELAPYRSEVLSLDEARYDDYTAVLEARMVQCCASVQAIIETALKSMLHIAPGAPLDRWTHDVELLAGGLAEPHRSEIRALLAPVPPPGITVWRSAGVYGSEHEEETAALTPDLAVRLVEIACATAERAAAALAATTGETSVVSSVRRKVADIRDYMAAHDLVRGRPTQPEL